MPLEKLTKGQVKLLQEMHDNPYVLKYCTINSRYSLYSGGALLRHLRFDLTLPLINYFFQKVKYENWTTTYTLRRDAEFTVEWANLEKERQDQAQRDAKSAEDAENSRLDQEATATFAVHTPGPYAIECSGRSPFSGYILFNGNYIANFSPAACSTTHKHLGELWAIPANAARFNALKELVNAGNLAYQAKEA